MNCDEACGIAALAASGDASPAELQGLKAHAAVCVACQAEIAGFEALRRQLHAMREWAAPDSAYAAVRARVISEIGGRRQRRWVMAWSSLAVAACAIGAVLMLHRESPVAVIRPQPAPVEMASIQNDEPEIPVARIRRAVRRVVAHKPAEPIVVHMFTSDPDVVIYWVADSKKEIVQ